MREPVWSRPWFVVALVFVTIWTLTTHGKYSVTGDEPHYLMMAESLLADGDLDLANNYAARAGVRFGAPDVTPEIHARPDRQGRLSSVHDVGLPVLVLPAYALARGLAGVVPASLLARVRMTPGLFAYSIVSLFMLSIACAGIFLLLTCLRGVAPAPLAAAIALAVSLSPPVLSNAFLVFPEVVAFTACCFAVAVAFDPRRQGRRVNLYVLAGVLGMLPWAHRKLSLLALGLLFVAVWARRRELRAWPPSAWAALIALFAAPQAALYLRSLQQWHSLAGGRAEDGLPFSWPMLQAGLLGMAVDRENGLLLWAPIYLFVPALWWLTRSRSWTFAVPLLLLVLPAAAHYWWGGFSPAGRFLVPLVPLAAMTAAWGLPRARLLAWVIACVLPLQGVITAYGWQFPRTLWPQGTGVHPLLSRLPLGADLTGLFPSLRTAEGSMAAAVWWLAAVAAVNAAALVAVRAREARDASGRPAAASESLPP